MGFLQVLLVIISDRLKNDVPLRSDHNVTED